MFELKTLYIFMKVGWTTSTALQTLTYKVMLNIAALKVSISTLNDAVNKSDFEIRIY